MKVQCPKCGFTGNVADELIPDQGRFVGCPRCHERFLIQKPITESFEILETPDERIPTSRLPTEPQEVPSPTPQLSPQPRRAFWNSGGFMTWAAIVIFVIIVWAVISPNSPKTPSKTNDTIKAPPSSEVPAQPEVTIPSEPEVTIPEPVPGNEDSSEGLKPSYYEDDGTPVYGDDTFKDSNDSNVETRDYGSREQPLNSGGDDETVYITNTGECYHSGYCGYLKSSKIPISKSEAISRGYRPCSRCNP